MATAPTTVVEGQLRQARAALEDGLRSSADTRAEVLLVRFPAVAADTEAALELVYTEFAVREQLGQNPDPADWYARFPHWRTDLEQMFEVHRELKKEDAKRQSRSHPTLDYPALPPTTGDSRMIGEFEVLGELGRGGMGVVYKARQGSLGRVVAVKVILAGAHAGGRERERFRREAETAARLDHPNVVRIFAVGEHDGRAFCAMEFVDGVALADQLDGNPWPAQKAAELIQTVAAAAHHAHQNGVVHRDLKPANILLAKTGDGTSPKIVDFGLAKSLLDSDAGPTRTGDIVGTPAYMSPEQTNTVGGVIGPATDVWGVGVTLYELLVGHPPFQGATTVETLQQVRETEPVPPRRLRPTLPRDLEVICLKCLRKEPKHRYESAAALADDLGRFLRGEPIRARPVSVPEHLARWCRRKPLVAGLLATVLVLLVAGPLVFAALWLDARSARTAEANAGRAKDVALGEKDAALLAKDEAIEQLQHQRYGAQVAEAVKELNAGAVENARRILASTDPKYRHFEWDHLHRLCSSTTVQRPIDRTTFAAVDPTGRRTAWVVWGAGTARQFSLNLRGDSRPRTEPKSPYNVKRIQVRDESNALVREWTAEFGTVFSVSFADGGRRLVLTADDPALMVWEVETGKLVHQLPAVDPDMRTLVPPPSTEVALPTYVAGQPVGTESVQLWDATTGAKRAKYTAPPGETLVSFVPSPDQQSFAVSTQDVKTKETRRYRGRVTEGGEVQVTKAAFTLLGYDPTGRYALTKAESDDALLVEEVATGNVLHRLRADNRASWEVAVSPGATAVAVLHPNSLSVNYWQLPPGPPPTTSPPYRTPDRQFVPLRVPGGGIERIQLTDDGQLVALGQYGKWVTTYHHPTDGSREFVPEGVNALRYSSPTAPLPAVWFTPDGRRVYSSGKTWFNLWDVASGRSLHAVRYPNMDTYGSVVSPDGKRFLVAWVSAALVPTSQRSTVVEVYSTDPSAKLWDHKETGEPLLAARFTPSGEAVVLAGWKGRVETRSADTGKLLATSQAENPGEGAAVIPPTADAVYWLSPGADGTRVRVTAPDTATELRRFDIPERKGNVYRAAFLTTDRLLCSGWGGDVLQVWDTTAGRWVADREGAAGATVFDVTADGKRVVTLNPTQVAVWDAQTGQKLLTLPLPAANWQHRDVAVGHDGRQLAITNGRGHVRIWNTGR